MPWKIIGLCAATLTMFSFIPQIIKMHKSKCVKGVSLITLLQFTLGVSLWIIYGVYLKDVVIITANAVTLASLVVLLFLYFSYGKE